MIVDQFSERNMFKYSEIVIVALYLKKLLAKYVISIQIYKSTKQSFIK